MEPAGSGTALPSQAFCLLLKERALCPSLWGNERQNEACLLPFPSCSGPWKGSGGCRQHQTRQQLVPKPPSTLICHLQVSPRQTKPLSKYKSQHLFRAAPWHGSPRPDALSAGRTKMEAWPLGSDTHRPLTPRPSSCLPSPEG